MIRTLAVTTPTSRDLCLLTADQMRDLAGVDDGSQDAKLRARGLAMTASIMTECKIAIGQGADPTLWQETLTETVYQEAWATVTFALSRRHNVQITSITVDGTALGTTEYLVDPEAGILTRMCNDFPTCWSGCKTVVVYKAGFTSLPNDLVQAASDYFRALTLEGGRDPYVKSERVEIPGIETRQQDLWVGDLPSGGTVMPAMVSTQLTRYRNYVVA